MTGKTTIIAALLLLLASTPAHAFRCGRNIVQVDMHEVEVLKACGEPTTQRDLGSVVRGTYVPYRRSHPGGITVERFPGYGQYREEVVLTEFVYNFGPRKLMRRLLFEGGVLVSIETLGYGYLEK